ncbi:MAG: MFS transporter [Deltaproteobacteria bacterium]|nr:MFS transporter [Deltaproteobacteria bacterium]
MPTEPASSPSNKWFVLFAIGVGTFMSALDSSIVNMLLPVLRQTFHTNVAAIEWVTTVYLFVVSGVLLTFGRLGDLRGHKKLYLTGFIGFMSSSALCGLALTLTWLICCRALQALSAAMLFANSPAILTKTFPATQRGKALGLQATMTYLGLTIGPSLGGMLAQHLSWRAVFYLNVPVGAVALYLGYRSIPDDNQKHESTHFDKVGASLFFIGLFSLLLALNQGHAWGWSSKIIISLLLSAVIILTIFLKYEYQHQAPMLDLSLFKNLTFSVSAFSANTIYIAMFMLIFLMPFYLIQDRSLNISHAGLIMTAQPATMMIVASIAGALSDRLGVRLISLIGLFVLACGFFWLTYLTSNTPLNHVALNLAICGLGIGLFGSPNNSRLMGAAPRNRQGIAAAILASSRNLGMVLGVATAGAVYTTILAKHGDDAISTAVTHGFYVSFGIISLSFLILLLAKR